MKKFTSLFLLLGCLSCGESSSSESHQESAKAGSSDPDGQTGVDSEKDTEAEPGNGEPGEGSGGPGDGEPGDSGVDPGDDVPETCTITEPEPEPDTEYAEELTIVRELGGLTTSPALYDDTGTTPTTLQAGDLKTVYFDGLDYQGNKTKVFAWVGIPDNATAQNPVPGVVLVHGGGGTADRNWVTKWRTRGYAAIAIGVEGQTDAVASNTDASVGRWVQHGWPGPARSGNYGGSDLPVAQQWMYHAVADTVLANSLLRSQSFIDESQVGLMGISWGGVISSTVIGIDNRFVFAIPVFGCGDLDNADTYFKSLAGNEFYKRVWDPMVRMKNATMPVLWFSWENDIHFPLDRLAVSSRAAPGPRMLAVVPGMGHSGGQATSRSESYDFADSVLSGDPWCEQIDVSVNGTAAAVRFRSRVELTSAQLLSTADTGLSNERAWNEVDATLDNLGGGIWEARATLPAGTTAWLINVKNGATISSSGYQGENSGTDISPYLNVNETEWLNTDNALLSQGDSLQFAPGPEANGSWSWSGPTCFTSSERAPAVPEVQPAQAGEYSVTYTDDAGNVSRDTFLLTLQ